MADTFGCPLKNSAKLPNKKHTFLKPTVPSFYRLMTIVAEALTQKKK